MRRLPPCKVWDMSCPCLHLPTCLLVSSYLCIYFAGFDDALESLKLLRENGKYTVILISEGSPVDPGEKGFVGRHRSSFMRSNLGKGDSEPLSACQIICWQ